MNSEDYRVNRTILARHKIVDFYNCNPSLLTVAGYLEDQMKQAATKAGCAIVGVKSHQFKPMGATVMVLVAESHLSIHTWPEKNKALLDVFASGDMNLQAAVDHMAAAIEAKAWKTIDIERG